MNRDIVTDDTREEDRRLGVAWAGCCGLGNGCSQGVGYGGSSLLRKNHHAEPRGQRARRYRVRALPVLTGMLALVLAVEPSATGRARGLQAQTNRPGQAQTNRLSSIRSVMEAPVDTPFRVRGTVTRVSNTLVLQDQTGGVEALPSRTPVVEVGDEVEITGKAAARGDKRVLADAAAVDLWHSSPPPPLALQPDDAANGEHNDVLVQVEGRLLHVADEDGTVRLQMEGGHQFYTAELPHAEGLDTPARKRWLGLPINSVVRLTGVLSLHAQQYSVTDGSFSLLLREPDDAEVVKGPPWGTTAHIVELVLGLVVLGALMQAAHVHSVRRQFRAILAERARIARDVHDTLAQGFAGIALQLEVVRGDMGRDPAEAEGHLRMAVGMVRHCRAEAHRSISTLRAFSQPMPLEAMLREMVGSVTGASRAEIRVEVRPLTAVPPQPVAEQLFRICQEAVSNAVQHAAATRITVLLREVERALELSVCDNGHGFDVQAAGRPGDAHFGVLGMQERAAQLRARWRLTSHPGGTEVQVTVPARVAGASAGLPSWPGWGRLLRAQKSVRESEA